MLFAILIVAIALWLLNIHWHYKSCRRRNLAETSADWNKYNRYMTITHGIVIVLSLIIGLTFADVIRTI